jgi:hypothetical protein
MQNPTNFNILSAKVDFEKKNIKTFNFETGSKLSYVNVTIPSNCKIETIKVICFKHQPKQSFGLQEYILSGYGYQFY